MPRRAKKDLIQVRLKKDEQARFDALAQKYISDPTVQSMKNFVQHGDTSTFDHCVSVAQTCLALNERLSLGADEKALVSAAMLHDFYLYDWHEKAAWHKWHGFHHAHTAAVNAKEILNLGDTECRAIESHMWPLNITKIPMSRTAWIICLADKCCAVSEMFKTAGKNDRCG